MHLALFSFYKYFNFRLYLTKMNWLKVSKFGKTLTCTNIWKNTWSIWPGFFLAGMMSCQIWTLLLSLDACKQFKEYTCLTLGWFNSYYPLVLKIRTTGTSSKKFQGKAQSTDKRYWNTQLKLETVSVTKSAARILFPNYFTVLGDPHLKSNSE